MRRSGFIKRTVQQKLTIDYKGLLNTEADIDSSQLVQDSFLDEKVGQKNFLKIPSILVSGPDSDIDQLTDREDVRRRMEISNKYNARLVKGIVVRVTSVQQFYI